MKTIAVILSFLLFPFGAITQIVFKTVVQQQIVEVGKSFSVEYLLEQEGTNDGFTQPYFHNLRLVNGPAIYPGKVTSSNGVRPVKNYVFTLVAVKPGRYIIPGASANMNGHFIKSDDVIIEAVEKTEKDENDSEYFLRPGEDPYEKIRKNLFMTVMVNKRSCYIGQPVVATFKLYSRLQSKSDIVKNPGFYGFSVQDIINLDDNISNTETINGKAFDVHTIRTVQLYPLQAGVFAIDPMEVMNKVEFSKSIVNKKTEQQVSEGYFENGDDKNNDMNTVVYDNRVSTEGIEVRVKPYPEKNKPQSFNGATGSFTISTALENNGLSRNEQGILVVTIRGKGNFTQLTQPLIQWPKDMEGFDAQVKDSLDKTQVPLKGSRSFHFPFSVNQAGVYTIPSVSLSFFDTDSNKYKTASTGPVEIKINQQEKETPARAYERAPQPANRNIYLLALAGALLLLSAFAWWYLSKNGKTKISSSPAGEKNNLSPVDEILKPVYAAMEKNDNRFYSILQKTIWEGLGKKLNLSGSRMNKSELLVALNKKNVPGDILRDILHILQECEAAAFTKAEFMHDKEELLATARKALELVMD